MTLVGWRVRLSHDGLVHVEANIPGQLMANWTPLCEPDVDWRRAQSTWADPRNGPTCLRCVAASADMEATFPEHR